MRPLSAPALVALVLSAGVAGAMLALAIAAGVAEASQRSSLSEASSNLLSTALGAAIGALATYLGAHRTDTGDSSSQEPL